MGLIKVEVPSADQALFQLSAAAADVRHLIKQFSESDVNVPDLLAGAQKRLHFATTEVHNTCVRVKTAADAHMKAANAVQLLAEVATAILLGLCAGVIAKAVVRGVSKLPVWPVS